MPPVAGVAPSWWDAAAAMDWNAWAVPWQGVLVVSLAAWALAAVMIRRQVSRVQTAPSRFLTHVRCVLPTYASSWPLISLHQATTLTFIAAALAPCNSGMLSFCLHHLKLRQPLAKLLRSTASV